MSDTETSAKIKVTADTGGAVPKLEEAAKATDGLKTSAKAAGVEQKALAAEMKAGRAVIAGATKAMTEAAEATRDASLAERAFGKTSSEAAAATRAATAAQREATAAVEASAREVKRLEAELAKVRTETNAATPAMRRLEGQLDAARAAADKQATSLQRLQLEQLASVRATEQQARSLERRERLLKIVEDEEREATKAAEAQTRAIAASVAVVDAGTGAVHRTAEAHREAALVARAFGKDSKEAAAAQQAATIVQAAAGRAAAAASAEVHRLEAEIAKVRTETNATTPAMQRMEEQLLRARDAAAAQTKALEQLELEQMAVARGAKEKAAGFDFASAASSKLMSVLGPTALVGTLMGTATWLGAAAEETLQYQTALANLPFAIEGAQDSSRGLIDEQTLLASASQAVALKVATTEDTFNDLAESATILGARLQQPADQLLNNLVTALGRGSTELLDNAGIVMKTAQAQDLYAASIGKTAKQLTDHEKTTAFATEAFRAIKASADNTTVAFDSNAAMLVRWKVAAVDAMDAMTRSPITAMDAIEGVTDEIKRLETGFGEFSEMLDVYERPLETLEQRMLAITAATHGANQAGLEWVATQIMSAQQLEKVDDAKYAARAEQLRKIEEAQRQAAVREKEQAGARALSAALGRDRDAREEFGKEQGKAEKAGARGAAKGESAAAKAAKARAEHGENLHEFGSEMSTYAAKEAKRLREEKAKDQEKAWDAEEQLHERRDLAFERELEMIEARGLAEEEAQAAREDLMMRRMSADERYAEHARDIAATEEQRQVATTQLEAAEHAKRIAAKRKQVAAEQKEENRRAGIFAKVNSHITGLGESLVAAAWAQAEGEKGAVAASVAAYAKGVAQKMALKALEETALGVAALAGIVTAGLAPPHFAAAALAGAAAVAAGAAAGAFGAIANAQAGGGGGAGASGFRSAGGGGGSASASGGQQLQELNKIPVSREAEGRQAASSPNRQSPHAATRRGGDTINNFVLGGTEEQVGKALRKIVDDAGVGRGGTRGND